MPTPHLSINQRASDVPPAALVRAMKLLKDVSELLAALSPDEIEKAAARAHLDRRGNACAAYWRLFEARHRALVTSFATQRSAVAQLVRDHIEKGET
jgi:hypothetical protein